jgi:trigger factor
MKTEFTDVSETQKTVTIEIPSDVVDAEMSRVVKGYARQARIPGFRPGKVPASVVKQRFKDQILHDVMHDLIPRAVEEALQERGIEPVETPSIKDVTIEEGRPLTFTAAVETIPSFDPGDLSTIALRQSTVAIDDAAVEEAVEQLRARAAKYEPVEGRPVASEDTVVLHLDRTGPGEERDHHDDVTIQIGAPSNPPGFDENLIGLSAGEEKTFTVHFPETYPAEQYRDADVTYSAAVKDIRTRVLPELDDEFAKDIGEFESLAALRDRVRADLQIEADDHAKLQLRNDLLRELAKRVTFEPPVSLVDREMDRRVEELVRQLMQQRVDPRQSGVDWAQFRESQREAARDSVASSIVLAEIARRENLTVDSDDVDKQIEQFAEQAGRTPAALRAQLEKEGGISRLYGGLRREKAVDLALSRARIISE